ncbi:hypothetical protein HPP92_018542 [Vanilla planifolia]|uniref:S-adenosylmethionine decarboxylase proenzyme n=1 Tax=Vanilla planifolia TaxID=51239 RepID=A0A835QFS9_VANPL|nr:hypothetical protein HPP92_018542 [Vanilla planifolia]
MLTLEMCMTGLSNERASIFFKNSPNGRVFSAKEMTWSSGISEIIPEMEICDFEFDPCGYSMNGICNQALSTIHVTPEEGFSYASYEAMGFEPNAISYGCLIERVLRCFEPADFSVAVTIFGGHSFACSYGKKVDVDGYNCMDLVQQHLPGGGLLFIRASLGLSLTELALQGLLSIAVTKKNSWSRTLWRTRRWCSEHHGCWCIPITSFFFFLNVWH